MDELAAEVGVDPIEVREMNWIKHEEFPFTTVAGMTYDSGNYEAATARAKEIFGYDDLRAEQQQRRDSNDPVQLGIGVSTFTEMCGLAPSRVLGQLNYAAGGWEHADIRMLATGKVEVVTGTSPHGQGHETAWSQIVADRLGVPFEDVEVLHGDTPDLAPRHGHLRLPVARGRRRGGGQGGRQGDREGQARRRAPARGVRGRPGVRGGPVHGQGHRQGRRDPGHRAARVPRARPPRRCRAASTPRRRFDPDNFSFPHGTHLCAMEVDTETGATTMRKYVAVDDIGTIINPLIVSGQVHGGLVQGIAQALWEEAVYDESGTLVTGSFVDYTLPTAADTISFDIDHTTSPSTYTQLGTKGVGEAGTIASTPAVVNAIVDAVRPMGVNDIRMPCTPERVFKAIQTAGKGGATDPEAQPHFDADTANADPAAGSTQGGAS